MTEIKRRIENILAVSPAQQIKVTMDSKIPEDTMFWMHGVETWGHKPEIITSPSRMVNILMLVDGERFKDEPFNAVFNTYGFTDKALDISAAYCKAHIHNKIDVHHKECISKFQQFCDDIITQREATYEAKSTNTCRDNVRSMDWLWTGEVKDITDSIRAKWRKDVNYGTPDGSY